MIFFDQEASAWLKQKEQNIDPGCMQTNAEIKLTMMNENY